MQSRGILMCAGSAVLFGLMAFAASAASRSATGAQVAMVRFAGSIVVVAFLSGALRRSLRPVSWTPLIVRGVAGGTAVLLYFLTIGHLGAGLATLLNYTSPVWSAILARAVLGEPLRRRTIAGLTVAIAGVTLVLVGGRGLAHPAAVGWIAVGLLSAMLSGIAVTAIRVARRTDGALEVFASFAVVGTLCTAPVALAGPAPAVDLQLIGLILAVIGTSTGAQLLMTSALRWVDTPTQGVVAQIAVVVSYGLSVAFLGEPVTALSLAGSVVTMTGVLLAVTARPVPPPAGRPAM